MENVVMVTAEFLLKVIILAVVPILTMWGACVMHKGCVMLRLHWIKRLDGRNARLAGLIALCEAAAGISFVLGHTTSAVTMLALTLPLLALILADEVTLA